MFYISKISVTGNNVKPAILEFEKGVNIVYGPSDTGKSYILDCINFVMGSEESRIETETGYDTVHVVVSVDGKDISFHRQIDSSDIDVVSTSSLVESGKYTTGSGKKAVTHAWMPILGIPDDVKIYRTVGMQETQLTIRMLYQMFYLDENRIDALYSILKKSRETYPVQIKTRLLYLLYGETYNDGVKHQDKKISAARKNAKIAFIKEKLASISDQKAEVTPEGNELSSQEIHRKITEILNEIENTQGEISCAVERRQEVAKEIIDLYDQLAECAMMGNRYKVLREQYASDVQRLTFLVEGESLKSGVKKAAACPFCGGELDSEKEHSCATAAYAEVKRILPQIKDLEAAAEDILRETDRLNGEIAALEIEQEDLDKKLDGELRPKIEELREHLVQYTFAIEQNKEMSVLSRLEEQLKEELRLVQKQPVEEVHFDADEKFQKEFFTNIDKLLMDALTESNFEGLNQVYFDFERLDVVVNKKEKRKYGQGYRAYLNSMVALAFREYLHQYGAYQTQIVLLDSPIMSLKEKPVTNEASSGMKHGLFQYVINHADSGQTIIVENEIPDTVDYSSANMIEFTKDMNNGRYGFLYGVK